VTHSHLGDLNVGDLQLHGGPFAVGDPVIAPAAVPVALLPIGLETRFVGDQLLVRIIPDEIHVEDHEPALTDGEVEAGRGFWRAVWRAGTAEPAATEAEQQAWVRLVTSVGSSRRSSWVADQTAPPVADRPASPSDTGDPAFPEPARRTGAWSQAAAARTLPGAFVAVAYQRVGSGGGASWQELARATGAPVADSIQLGPDPTALAVPPTNGGPAVPDGLRWLVDVGAAEQAGLLVRVPLPPGTTRIDRLVVLGVVSSVDPDTAATQLADLLVGHHHTSGLEVLPVGTPTNNTAADASGYARVDDPVHSFAVERRTPAPADGTDGGLLARALGVSADALRGVAHSNDAEQAAAGQMNALVWPTSLGYWLDTLVQPGPSDRVIDEIRHHAVSNVRGRGPLPPLRIGRQPYGVLPVTSTTHWKPGTEPAGVVAMAGILQSAYCWWLDGTTRTPIVRAGQDPDQGVLDAMSHAPVSTTVGVRSMVGANASYIPNDFGVVGTSAASQLAAEGNRQRYLALTGFRALGITGYPYLGQLVAAADPVPLLHLPYTVDPQLTPTEQATAWAGITAYLTGLRRTGTAALTAQDPHGYTSLLALIARRSVLLERLRSGLKDTHGSIAGNLVEAHLRLDSAPVVNAALITTSNTLRIGETRSAASALLGGSVRQVDGTVRSMVDHLDLHLVQQDLTVDTFPGYAETVHAAEAVAALAPDRAALLLGESLDVASYRFDAWATSLATRRLADLRATTPTGVTLGAYGAVEDLTRRPARPAVAQVPDGAPTPLLADVNGGGFVHAPSLGQAATAAVLRAGHLSHTASDPHAAALAIDLSSSRVRTAIGLLDGVREGQPIGALLGYLVERRLHEGGAHTAVEVVRELAPPPVVTATGSPEGIPPRAVCDGLALSRLDPTAVLSAAQAAGADRAATQTALAALGDAVDAVADLLLAESVHQVVRGNPERAAAALDTLNRGDGAIVDPEVVRTPRTGTGLTHRVLVVIGPDAPPAPGWPTDGIRAQAEPALSAWAGHLLGDPTGLAITVTSPAPAGQPASAVVLDTVTLADLGLGALDVVFEPLLPRVLRHARRLGAAEGAAVDLAGPGIAPLLTTAELLHDLLVHARPGSGLDLARAQDRGGVVIGPPTDDSPVLRTTVPDVDQGAVAARLTAAREHLQVAAATLPEVGPADPTPDEVDLVPTLDALAAFGLVPGGDPSRPVTAGALASLKAEATSRMAAAAAAPGDAAALFGEGFPVLPQVASPVAPAFAAALAVDPVAATPAAVLAALGGAGQAVASWLERHGRVRNPVARLADVLLAARLRGTAEAGRLAVAQLPAEPFPTADVAHRAQWIGATFPAPLGPEPVTAFVLHALGTIDPAAGVGVLVVDDFTEVVPALETTTGIAFGFDAPGARPPQSVLLAVPPVPGQAWTLNGLAQVVGETLDLAKIRMVDLSSVAWAGRFVPTIHLTDGDVSSPIDLPMKDVVRLAAEQFARVHL
jgi:hypothetical protein